MPDPQTTDPVAGRIEWLCKRLGAARTSPESFDLDVLLGEAAGALHGYDRLLKLHEPMTLYKIAVSSAESTDRVLCGHDPDLVLDDGDSSHILSTENDDILCLEQPETTVCDFCWDEDGERTEWPCPTRAAITEALTGEGGSE